MKISELNTQSFLGGTNVPANSYVLINYAESDSAEPVTKKVSVQELGKAIANDQQLYKKTSGGAVTTSVNNGAYTNGTAEKMVTSSEKELLGHLGYYVTGGDSAPHLTVEAYGTPVKILTNKSYYDAYGYGGLPVVYDSYDNQFKYISLSDSLVNVNVSNTPEVKEMGDSTYNYLFYDTSTASAYYIQSNITYEIGQPLFWDPGMSVVFTGHGDDATTLGMPVFWDDTDEALKLYDGTEINAGGGGGTPYVMDISDMDFYYVLNKDGDFYVTDSQGSDSVKLGTPIFYSENESGFGYYASGSFHLVDGITLRSSGE